MEDLVALSNKVTLPGKPLLGVGVGEKKGCNQEAQNVALMVGSSQVAFPRDGGGIDTMEHRANV